MQQTITQRARFLLIVSLAAITVFGMITMRFEAHAAGSATFRLSPALQDVTAGSDGTLTLAVTASNDGLAGGSVIVTFPSDITFEAYTPGAAFEFFNAITNGASVGSRDVEVTFTTQSPKTSATIGSFRFGTSAPTSGNVTITFSEAYEEDVSEMQSFDSSVAHVTVAVAEQSVGGGSSGSNENNLPADSSEPGTANIPKISPESSVDTGPVETETITQEELDAMTEEAFQLEQERLRESVSEGEDGGERTNLFFRILLLAVLGVAGSTFIVLGLRKGPKTKEG